MNPSTDSSAALETLVTQMMTRMALLARTLGAQMQQIDAFGIRARASGSLPRPACTTAIIVSSNGRWASERDHRGQQ